MNERITVRELSQLRHIKREIEIARRRLAALRGAMATLPSSSAETEASDFEREAAALESLIKDEMRLAIKELLRLQRFINGMEDIDLRCIFYYRYIKCMSWNSISFAMGYIGEQVPRRMHNSYLAHRRSIIKGVHELSDEKYTPEPESMPLPDPVATLRRAVQRTARR